MIVYFNNLEYEQLTGSFKIRGALNKLLKLLSAGDVVKHSRIITASSGNHGIACVNSFFSDAIFKMV